MGEVRCFYCGEPTVPYHKKLRNTADHVYPKSLLHTVKVTRTTKWHALNLVPAHSDCNNHKGRLHPLDWLVIMPNSEQAKKLAERLVALGEDLDAVFSAMRRRKR